MKQTDSILSEERREAIRIALIAWCDQQTNKGAAAKKLDMKTNELWALRRGVRPVPPKQLATLYQETKDSVFLFSADERARYERLRPQYPLPSEEEWPTSPSSSTLTELSQLVEPSFEDVERAMEIAHHVAEIFIAVSKLPAGHPIRERARKNPGFVKTAMGVYQAAKMIGIEFPDVFSDLEKQLETARLLS